MESTLRKLRGFDLEPDTCRKASDLTQGELVRLYSRSLVAIAGYDTAIVKYCRDYFDRVGNSDINFRHDVCGQLRGAFGFAYLFAIYLDSEWFKISYEREVNRTPPTFRTDQTPPTPNTYIDLISEMRVLTLLEESSGGKLGANRQQGRLIAAKAKEVELVEYLFIRANKTEVLGTKHLHDFFSTWLPKQLDVC